MDLWTIKARSALAGAILLLAAGSFWHACQVATAPDVTKDAGAAR